MAKEVKELIADAMDAIHAEFGGDPEKEHKALAGLRDACAVRMENIQRSVGEDQEAFMAANAEAFKTFSAGRRATEARVRNALTRTAKNEPKKA